MPAFRSKRSRNGVAAAEGGRIEVVRRSLSWSALRPSSWPNSALAAFLAGLLVLTWFTSDLSHLTAQQVAGGLVTLVPFFLLPWRPRIPELLLVTAAACLVIAAALGTSGGADFVMIAAVYTVAAERTERAAVVAIAVAMAGESAATILGPGTVDLLTRIAGWIVVGLLCVCVAALGRAMARRRDYVQKLVVRTEDLKRERDELEREREVLAREAVAVERARIARELHDVVAHHVSVMVIQTGAAQTTLPPNAQATYQSLEAIRQTGREALAEMRRLLGLLRSEASLDAPDGRGGREEREDDDAEARAPQPGLAELEALAERTREAGLIVDVETTGASRVPAGVDLSAYRIVQEALTNTLRHGGVGARVHVCLDFEPGELVVEVVDDGRGRRSHPVDRGSVEVGHGLVGMRERVALFGGRLETGPRTEGGFRVLARFPLDDPAATPEGSAIMSPSGEAPSR